MKPTFIIATGLLVLGVSGLALIATVASPVPVVAAQAASSEQTTTFDVPGMTCALCPVTVRKAMESVAGVTKVEVDFNARTATVAFDPSKATIESIATASENAGYPAHIAGE